MAAFAKNLFSWMGNRIAGEPSALPDVPKPLTPPQPDQAPLIAAAAARQRRLMTTTPAFNGTLLTGPQGIEQAATTAKPSLLGQ